VYLCFDADAAGQEATLRGMELAVTQGFDVHVVTLPPGQDPADASEGFADRLGGAESYLHYRVRIEIERASDRQEAFVRAREILQKAEDSPERQEALRLLADRLDLPKETLGGIAPARGAHVTAGAGVAGATGGGSATRLLDAGIRLERDLLAACVAHPELVEALGALTGDHFADPLYRRFRDVLVVGGDEDAELTALRAELGARAERDAIDERTGRELILRLRERAVRRELQGADLVRATELQAHLATLRQALAEL
jgi:DNA primase